MFHNVMMTGLTTPLCNTDEMYSWDNRPFARIWPEHGQKSFKGAEVTKTIRKKPKRVRTAFTTDQLRALEKTYNSTRYIDSKRRKQLASQLNIGDKSVKIWFQNRRMKEKKDSESSSCDSSSESFTNAASPPNDKDERSRTYDKNLNSKSPLSALPPTDIQQSPNATDVNVESTKCTYSDQTNNVYNTEPQHQVSYVEYENYYLQNYYTQNAIQAGSSFYYDTSVYPTEHYPNTQYYTNQYQLNNWSNNFNTTNHS